MVRTMMNNAFTRSGQQPGVWPGPRPAKLLCLLCEKTVSVPMTVFRAGYACDPIPAVMPETGTSRISRKLRGAMNLALYFVTPEDSERPLPLRRSRSHKAAKALFWLAASVAAGLLLGQLS